MCALTRLLRIVCRVYMLFLWSSQNEIRDNIIYETPFCHMKVWLLSYWYSGIPYSSRMSIGTIVPVIVRAVVAKRRAASEHADRMLCCQLNHRKDACFVTVYRVWISEDRVFYSPSVADNWCMVGQWKGPDLIWSPVQADAFRIFYNRWHYRILIYNYDNLVDPIGWPRIHTSREPTTHLLQFSEQPTVAVDSNKIMTWDEYKEIRIEVGLQYPGMYLLRYSVCIIVIPPISKEGQILTGFIAIIWYVFWNGLEASYGGLDGFMPNAKCMRGYNI